MSSLYLLIPLSLGVVALAVGFFLAAVRGGQFEDLDRPAGRMPDDEP